MSRLHEHLTGKVKEQKRIERINKNNREFNELYSKIFYNSRYGKFSNNKLQS